MSKIGVIGKYSRQCGAFENKHVTQQFLETVLLQIRLFKLQIPPMGNIACRQTCNHSKTLSDSYVSGEKNFGRCEIFVITFL